MSYLNEIGPHIFEVSTDDPGILQEIIEERLEARKNERRNREITHAHRIIKVIKEDNWMPEFEAKAGDLYAIYSREITVIRLPSLVIVSGNNPEPITVVAKRPVVVAIVKAKDGEKIDITLGQVTVKGGKTVTFYPAENGATWITI